MRYPSKTLVKSITPVPRTMSEANRDARYACAIQTFKSDAKLTLDFLYNACMGMLLAFFALTPFVLGFIAWLNN
jgi:hypothetical protein